MVAAIGILALAIWLVAITISIIGAARKRHWRRVISLAVILIVVWPEMLLLLRSGDYVHLALMYPHYRAMIDNAPKLTIPWGDVGGPGVSPLIRVLVYDRTGETAAEIGVHPDRTEPAISVATAHLIGDFYLRTATW
jgi:hypothetical protein